ncbi:MAG TPA: RNA polymerase sigma factor [Candidatus Paceibacterota bacterium]|nr:RNA polymerase sigma factor [Candidatus Paceibacterota bacterium]
MEKSDAELIAAYLNGEEEAFAALVDRYAPHVFRFIYALTHHGEESDDLTQEVFVKIWKNLSKFNQEKNFRSWAFAIAKNTVIDWSRRKKVVLFSDLDSATQSFESTLSDGALPEDFLEKKDLAESVRQVMGKLSSQNQSIFFLHVMEGRTFQEISDLLDMPMNTVKSLYRRMLLAFRKNVS